MTYDYDVLVLGGGSAGTAAAATASQAGARTAMINDGELGGLCILRGCMPTKTMLASTHLLHEASHADPLGVHIDPGAVSFDFPFIMQRKAQLVARFKRAKIAAIESADYEVIDARGAFADAHTIDLGDRHVTSRSVVLTVGSVPIVPEIPGLESVPLLTSDDVMDLTQLPDSLLVQGAGPIGLEFAEFFARLGVRTVLVNRSRPFSKIDPDIADEFAGVCDAQANLTVHAPARIVRFTPGHGRSVATLETENGTVEVECAAYLCALGRRAAVDAVGLDRAGVETDGAYVRHNDYMQTTAENVYVAGDATGAYQLLHIGNQEGRVAGYNAAVGRADRTMDYRLKMSVVFTDPPVATLGMTASEAEAAGYRVVTATKRFPEQGRAITMGVEHGVLKLVTDRDSGEILGCQILGPRADDLIHIPAAVMAHHGTARDLYDLPWYHPTLAEAFVEVARATVAELAPA